MVITLEGMEMGSMLVVLVMMGMEVVVLRVLIIMVNLTYGGNFFYAWCSATPL